MNEAAKTRAIKDLKMLNGLPPYDDASNPCNGDGYFANDIEKRFKMTITELEKEVGFAELRKKWKAARAAFLV